MPTGLVVEADGSFLVADRGNARVLRFREGQGELVLGPDLVERPWGLAVDHHGSIFVSDEKRGVVLKLPESGVATGTGPAGFGCIGLNIGEGRHVELTKVAALHGKTNVLARL
eukprot:g12360.t1